MSFETLCHNSPIMLSEIYTGFFFQEWNKQSMESSATILIILPGNFLLQILLHQLYFWLLHFHSEIINEQLNELSCKN